MRPGGPICPMGAAGSKWAQHKRADESIRPYGCKTTLPDRGVKWIHDHNNGTDQRFCRLKNKDKTVREEIKNEKEIDLETSCPPSFRVGRRHRESHLASVSQQTPMNGYTQNGTP